MTRVDRGKIFNQNESCSPKACSILKLSRSRSVNLTVPEPNNVKRRRQLDRDS